MKTSTTTPRSSGTAVVIGAAAVSVVSVFADVSSDILPHPVSMRNAMTAAEIIFICFIVSPSYSVISSVTDIVFILPALMYVTA